MGIMAHLRISMIKVHVIKTEFYLTEVISIVHYVAKFYRQDSGKIGS